MTNTNNYIDKYTKMTKENMFKLFLLQNLAQLPKTVQKQIKLELDPSIPYNKFYKMYCLYVLDKNKPECEYYRDQDGILTPYAKEKDKYGHKLVKCYEKDCKKDDNFAYAVGLKSITKKRDLTPEEKEHLRFSLESLYSYKLSSYVINKYVETTYITNQGEFYNAEYHLVFRQYRQCSIIRVRFGHKLEKALFSIYGDKFDICPTLDHLLYNRNYGKKLPVSNIHYQENTNMDPDFLQACLTKGSIKTQTMVTQLSWIDLLFVKEDSNKYIPFTKTLENRSIVIDIDNGARIDYILESLNSLELLPHKIITEKGVLGTKKGNTSLVYHFDFALADQDLQDFKEALDLHFYKYADTAAIDPQCTCKRLHKNPFTMDKDGLTHDVLILNRLEGYSYKEVNQFINNIKNKTTSTDRSTLDKIYEFIGSNIGREYKYNTLSATEITKLHKFKKFKPSTIRTKKNQFIVSENNYKKNNKSKGKKLCLTKYSPEKRCSVGKRNRLLTTNTYNFVMQAALMFGPFSIEGFEKFIYQIMIGEDTRIEDAYSIYFSQLVTQPEKDPVTYEEIKKYVRYCATQIYVETAYREEDKLYRKLVEECSAQLNTCFVNNNHNIKHFLRIAENDQNLKNAVNRLIPDNFGTPEYEDNLKEYAKIWYQKLDKLGLRSYTEKARKYVKNLKTKKAFTEQETEHANNVRKVTSLTNLVLTVNDITEITKAFINIGEDKLQNLFNTNSKLKPDEFAEFICKGIIAKPVDPIPKYALDKIRNINIYTYIDKTLFIFTQNNKKLEKIDRTKLLNFATLPIQIATRITCDIWKNGLNNTKYIKKLNYEVKREIEDILISYKNDDLKYYYVFTYMMDICTNLIKFNNAFNPEEEHAAKQNTKAEHSSECGNGKLLNNVNDKKIVDKIIENSYDNFKIIDFSIVNLLLYINETLRKYRSYVIGEDITTLHKAMYSGLEFYWDGTDNKDKDGKYIIHPGEGIYFNVEDLYSAIIACSTLSYSLIEHNKTYSKELTLTKMATNSIGSKINQKEYYAIDVAEKEGSNLYVAITNRRNINKINNLKFVEEEYKVVKEVMEELSTTVKENDKFENYKEILNAEGEVALFTKATINSVNKVRASKTTKHNIIKTTQYYSKLFVNNIKCEIAKINNEDPEAIKTVIEENIYKIAKAVTSKLTILLNRKISIKQLFEFLLEQLQEFIDPLLQYAVNIENFNVKELSKLIFKTIFSNFVNVFSENLVNSKYSTASRSILMLE